MTEIYDDQQQERSNVGAVEAGYLQGDQQGEEVTRGYEMFGLELGWEEERRLGDSRKNKQPMTYVEAQVVRHRKTGIQSKIDTENQPFCVLGSMVAM